MVFLSFLLSLIVYIIHFALQMYMSVVISNFTIVNKIQNLSRVLRNGVLNEDIVCGLNGLWSERVDPVLYPGVRIPTV